MQSYLSLIAMMLSQALGSIILLLVISLIAWRLGFFHLVPSRQVAANFPGSRTGWAFIVYVLSQLLVYPLIVGSIYRLSVGEGFNPKELDSSYLGWYYLGSLFFASFCLFSYAYFSKNNLFYRVWGKVWDSSWMHHWSVGGMTWMLSLPTVGLVGYFTRTLVVAFSEVKPTEQQLAVVQVKSTFDDPVLFWFTVFTIAVVVPILEEFLFRGFLHRWIRTYLPIFWATILSSIIFACFHYAPQQGLANIELLASLFTLSCFLCYLLERQGNLWGPIGLHMVQNASSVALLVLQHSESSQDFLKRVLNS